MRGVRVRLRELVAQRRPRAERAVEHFEDVAAGARVGRAVLPRQLQVLARQLALRHKRACGWVPVGCKEGGVAEEAL